MEEPVVSQGDVLLQPSRPVVLADDIYELEIRSAQLVKSQYGNDQLELSLAVDDHTGEPKAIRHWLPATHFPDNKLAEFLEAVLGAYDSERAYSARDLVGKKFKGFVKMKGKYAKLDSVVRARGLQKPLSPGGASPAPARPFAGETPTLVGKDGRLVT